jgi:hypothetical protein
MLQKEWRISDVRSYVLNPTEPELFIDFTATVTCQMAGISYWQIPQQ